MTIGGSGGADAAGAKKIRGGGLTVGVGAGEFIMAAPTYTTVYNSGNYSEEMETYSYSIHPWSYGLIVVVASFLFLRKISERRECENKSNSYCNVQ
jgi:hypothetical protein